MTETSHTPLEGQGKKMRRRAQSSSLIPQIEGTLNTIRLDRDFHSHSRTSVQLSWSQLQKLVDDFDLGRMIQMDVPTQTQCNTTDPFRTGQGTFLLRARHGEEYIERVEYLHGMINDMIEQGFPVPEVMRKRNGKTWTLWGERLVEIHRFVPHDAGSHRDWQRMNSAASMLGDLHRCLDNASRRRTPVPPEMRNDIGPAQCMALIDEGVYVVAQYTERDPATAEAQQVLQRAREVLGPMADNYERMVGSLPWLTVHGDYHFWNLLYKADQIAAVVDYDFMQERERLFDIAYAMQSVIAHLTRVHGNDVDFIPKQAWQNLRLWVDLYDETTHVPLTRFERERLPGEILRIFLVSIATSCGQENPIELLTKCGQELNLHLWLSEQRNMFL
ncbi:MAG TPA: phosphotransferase [Chthoniobacterales bacterium]|jgi:Ser/Thr protein kinase RdoA (MazF antagonist)